ncbi:MAG TPA: hypothetical protein VFT49_02165 [Candidatus Saccharimonadales bacterium]|nr:hypothetical protein [Candidatus Saccharimonadales bacterium]
MKDFEAKSLCVLGRQPKLGAAELESLFGADHVKYAGKFALLDLPGEEINFKRLGGTVKTARILATLPYTNWPKVAAYLRDSVPEHLKSAEPGKFTLGISVYGLSAKPNDINKLNLGLKKQIRASGRPVRVVPNKTLDLNSAQVLHNGLTRRGAWELLLVRHGEQTLIAQTLFIQDIETYAARDQNRPKRDARVGMLPPKLAQIIVNLATGQIEQRLNSTEDRPKVRILDPFCGTGVILQEAMLMGYSVMGTDLEPRMVDFTKQNLAWLVEREPKIETQATVEVGDATNYSWPGFSVVASEIFLGRPLAKLPSQTDLKQIISDTNTITKKFLANIAGQLKSGQRMCLAVPAWRIDNDILQKLRLSEAQGSGEQRAETYTKYGEGAAESTTQRFAKSTSGAAGSAGRQSGAAQFLRLPLIDHLTDMGYNYLDLSTAAHEDLIYFREDQVVARQLIILEKK